MQGRAKVERATEHDTLSRSTALITHDHYSILVHPERDAPEQFQEGVRKLKDEFIAIDKEVRAGGEIVVRGIGQMIPALAKMEPFLCRKGEHHDPHHVKMLVAAGLPTWEEYKRQVAAEFELSVRQVQRKLAEHRGHPKEHRRLSDGTRTRPDATAARNLADAKKQFGAAAAAGSTQAAAIIAEYESAVDEMKPDTETIRKMVKALSPTWTAMVNYIAELESTAPDTPELAQLRAELAAHPMPPEYAGLEETDEPEPPTPEPTPTPSPEAEAEQDEEDDPAWFIFKDNEDRDRERKEQERWPQSLKKGGAIAYRGVIKQVRVWDAADWKEE